MKDSPEVQNAVAKHTPEPWEIEEDFAGPPSAPVGINGGGKAICNFLYDPTEPMSEAEIRANAELIVAAPKTAAALAKLKQDMVVLGDHRIKLETQREAGRAACKAVITVLTGGSGESAKTDESWSKELVSICKSAIKLMEAS